MTKLSILLCGNCGGHEFALVYGRVITDFGALTYDVICSKCGEQPNNMTLYDEVRQ